MKNRITIALLAVTLAAPALHAARAQDIPTPEAVMAMVDTNKDGAIDPMEWAAGPAPIPYPVEADTNKDGKIDLAELTVLFQQFQNQG